MYIQPVNHSIKVDGLATFLHPLDYTCNMITPKSHAHQLLNQFIVRMVTNELWIANHMTWSCGWLWSLRATCWRISTLTVMRHLSRIWISTPFTIIHHICTPWGKCRVRPSSGIPITLLSSKSTLDLLLGWRLLWHCSTSSAIPKRHGIRTTRTRLRNTRI